MFSPFTKQDPQEALPQKTADAANTKATSKEITDLKSQLAAMQAQLDVLTRRHTNGSGDR
jgi:polyhydroxyalkanoate synthesis regulator protein